MSTTITHPRSATELLRDDHTQLLALFERYDPRGHPDQKRAAATQICQLLMVHALCEEELLYPQARLLVDAGRLDVQQVQHMCMTSLIARIEDTPPQDELFDAQLEVLAEYFRMHIRFEAGLFEQLAAADVDLSQLRDQLLLRRAELFAQFGAAADAEPPLRLRRAVR